MPKTKTGKWYALTKIPVDEATWFEFKRYCLTMRTTIGEVLARKRRELIAISDKLEPTSEPEPLNEDELSKDLDEEETPDDTNDLQAEADRIFEKENPKYPPLPKDISEAQIFKYAEE